MLGWGAFFIIISCVIMALAGLVFAAPPASLFSILSDSEIWRVLRFTLFQAGLSTLLSLGLAIPVARALARRQHFFARQWLIQLSSLPLVIPTMVAILGITVVHGRNGWGNQLLGAIGFDGYTLYGLNGILLAHVFFNLPLAARSYLTAIQSLPQETWRLANQLGLSSSGVFWHIEWPLIRAVIPGLAGLIFMLCFTSFSIVLALGGGPKYATLEVAIYQALRFDFDIARGVMLAGIQILACLALLAILGFRRQSFTFQLGANRSPSSTPDDRPDTANIAGKWLDSLVLIIAGLFLLSPLVAVVIRALTPSFSSLISSAQFLQALWGSIIIASSAGFLALVLAIPIAFLLKNLQSKRHTSRQLVIETGSSLILVVPPLTLGMGLFLLLRHHASVFDIGIYLVILVNSLLAVPFVLRIIQSPIYTAGQELDRLSDSLGVRGWQRCKWLYWPNIRRPLGFALALAMTLSLGDMGVIALFGTENLSTLPLYIYRQIGSYRMEQAAVSAFMLCLLCIATFWGIERFVGGKKHA